MKFSGKVMKNSGRGKKIGFPTANMEAPKDLENGLFLGLANTKPALIFIGANETFDETDRRVEVYILDFDGDLYGQTIEIEVHKKIRDVIKFESKGALIEQMKKDESEARKYFSPSSQT